MARAGIFFQVFSNKVSRRNTFNTLRHKELRDFIPRRYPINLVSNSETLGLRLFNSLFA